MALPIQSTKLKDLREEYATLFDTCVIRAAKQQEVEGIVRKVLAGRGRYEALAAEAEVPWYAIAAIHSLEAGLDFATHLHNGDSLRKRTVNVPKGRPTAGNPPFQWESSAKDALAYDGLTTWKDWSLAGTLYKLEAFNGWGTRLHGVFTSYLWSYCQHYVKGKYVKDGVWDSEKVSGQCGAAVILRRLAEKGEVDFPDQPAPQDGPMVVSYRATKSNNQDLVAAAERLQSWLNTFPGVFVKIDGVPGRKTSDAFKLVTGRYLPGDPQA